jgi:hypothetical protein
MMLPIDIFQKAPDGNVLWLEAASSVHDAVACVRAMAKPSAQKEYVILNQKNGQKLVVKFDGLAPVDMPANFEATALRQTGELK